MNKKRVIKLSSIFFVMILAGCSHTHTFGEAWKFDNTNHWHECACGEREDENLHALVYETGEGQHWGACSCGYVSEKSMHTFDPKWIAEDDMHFQQCICGEKESISLHTYNDGVVITAPENDVPGTKKFTCTVCGSEEERTYSELPDAPINLRVELGNQKSTLTWDAPENNGGTSITSYQVSISTNVENDDWQNSSLSRTHTFNAINNETDYVYKVRAFNENGYGINSEPVIIGLHAPDRVENLAATVDNRSSVVSWEAPRSDGNSPITEYEVQVAARAWVSVGLKTTYTATGLTNGMPCEISVRAKNAFLTGVPTLVTVTPGTVPTAPTYTEGELVTILDGAIILNWKAPSNMGGFDLLYYEISVNSGEYVSVGTNTTKTYTGLSNGQQYAFRIRAVTSFGPGKYLGVEATPVGAPSPVRNLRLIWSPEVQGKLTAKWDAPLNNGGVALSKYKITINGLASEQSTSSTEIEYIGLESGESYTISVVAINEKNLVSELTSVIGVCSFVPSAVTNLTATPQDSKVLLEWDAPENNHHSPIIYYEIRIGEDGMWISNLLNTSCLQIGLVNGKELTFYVRAVNEVGPGEAVSVSATPLAANPIASAPTFRTEESNYSALNMNIYWNAPEDTGGLDIDSYQIKVDDGNWVNRTPSATMYTIYNLTLGVWFTIQVRAVTAAGPGEIFTHRSVLAYVPAAPTNLSAVRGDLKMQLSWSPPSNDYTGTITHYEVKTNFNEEWIEADSMNQHLFALPNNDIHYNYYVRAVTEFKIGKDNRVNVRGLYPPLEVVDFTGTPEANKAVKLTWSTQTNATASLPTTFELWFNDSEERIMIPAAQLSYVFDGSLFTAGVPVNFHIRPIFNELCIGPRTTITVTPQN